MGKSKATEEGLQVWQDGTTSPGRGISRGHGGRRGGDGCHAAAVEIARRLIGMIEAATLDRQAELGYCGKLKPQNRAVEGLGGFLRQPITGMDQFP